MTRSHSDCLRNQGVDLKRRPPKSRPTAFPWRIASPPESGPQGLRRPRFSFFLFTCQTARDDGSPILGRTEGRRSHELPTEIGSCPASKSEELRRRAIAPSRGRHAVFGLYTLRPPQMSTCIVKNLTPRTCSMNRQLTCLRKGCVRRTEATFLACSFTFGGWEGVGSGVQRLVCRVGRRYYSSEARRTTASGPVDGPPQRLHRAFASVRAACRLRLTPRGGWG